MRAGLIPTIFNNGIFKLLPKNKRRAIMNIWCFVTIQWM